MPRNKLSELDRLLDDAMLYLSNKYDAGSLDIGNFFGKVVLKPPPEDAIDVKPPEPGQFGLYVLGSLNNSQIRMLSDLARSQITVVAEYQAKQKALMAKFQEMQKQSRPNRGLEREMQTLGKGDGRSRGQNGGLPKPRCFCN